MQHKQRHGAKVDSAFLSRAQGPGKRPLPLRGQATPPDYRLLLMIRTGDQLHSGEGVSW